MIVKKLSKKAAKKARRLARAKELIDSYLFYCGMAITLVKGHEPMLYEAWDVIVGPFSKFTL